LLSGGLAANALTVLPSQKRYTIRILRPSDHPRRAVRLGGGKKERQLSAGPIPPYQSAARPKKAIMAVASILTAIYHMLKMGRCTRTSAEITSIAVPATSKKIV
jgi:hypothetical protein